MNDKAKETFSKHGDLVGKSLIPCHNENSRAIIARLLETGGTNPINRILISVKTVLENYRKCLETLKGSDKAKDKIYN